jgi:hypothetical protein
MTPDRVIKHLDVIEYVNLGLFSGCIDSALVTLLSDTPQLRF